MQTLFTRHWPANGPARARLLIVHGFAEHSGRYGATAEALNARGFEVFAYDQRGHGNSPGRRGDIRDFRQLVTDLGAQAAAIAAGGEDRPLFLLAHSMGGLVAAHFLAARPPMLAGAIISSPLLVVPEKVPAWKRRMAGLLGAIVPRLPMERLDKTAISRDPAEVRAYENDPLVYHGPIRARTGAELLHAIQVLEPLLPAIALPLFVIHGTADRLAPIAGGRLLYSAAGSHRKDCYWEEGGYHELLNDRNRETVRSLIAGWLEETIHRVSGS